MVVDKMNLQLFADPEVKTVSDMNKDEIAEEIAKLEAEEEGEEGVELEEEEGEEGVELEEEEGEEELEEGEDGKGKGREGKKEDPYEFIKENTPYDSLDALVEGHKNIQSFATKVHQKNIELEERLKKMGKEGTEEIDETEEIGEQEVIKPQDVQKMIDLQVKKQLAEEREQDVKDREVEKFNDKLEDHYQEAIALEGWKENIKKVEGIIEHYPNMVEVYKGNPYKFALKLAADPELMKVYNQHPDLFNLEDGGADIAKGLLISEEEEEEINQALEIAKAELKEEMGEENIEDEEDEEEDEGIEKQIALENASVSTPSTNKEESIPIEDLSREEVYEAVNYKPD